MSGYRGRLAPSPTGLLHLGHARTFWTAFTRAQAAGGVLILRDEDLDTQRARPEFAAAMLEDLRWLGMHWQEGPDVTAAEGGGPFAPYRQSERYPRYRAAWQRLHAGGWIYPCRCSRRELAAAVSAPHEDGVNAAFEDEPLYAGTCRPAPGTIAEAEFPAAFEDSGAGPQSFTCGRDFGDFLVWRRDDVPAYQLACVVDDAAMQITEVVRGADLLKSTARQLLLYRALEATAPAWHHCPLLRDAAGLRLAKRSDALSLRSLRGRGLSPAEVRAMFVNPEAHR